MQPHAELERLAQKYRASKSRAGSARTELRSAVRQAIAAGDITQADAVRITGWTRETIRQLQQDGAALTIHSDLAP